MHLQYLVTNMAWVFFFGGTPQALYPRGVRASMFFATREAAVHVAHLCGLEVGADGSCSALHPVSGDIDTILHNLVS